MNNIWAELLQAADKSQTGKIQFQTRINEDRYAEGANDRVPEVFRVQMLEQAAKCAGDTINLGQKVFCMLDISRPTINTNPHTRCVPVTMATRNLRRFWSMGYG